jgi:hypothetical protein
LTFLKIHKTTENKEMKAFKKISLGILFVGILLGTCFADPTTIYTPISTALNASTYTAITTGSQECYGFAILLSDTSIAYYIAVSATGTGEVPIPAGTSISWPDYVPIKTIVLYAKSASGTPSLILFPAKRSQ